MARPTARFWSVVAIFAVINAAGYAWIHYDLTTRHRPRMRILSVAPTRDVDHAERLGLVFDEPIVDQADVGRPLDRSPFTLLPAADGHWQWGQADRLEFVLAKPLPPGRVFRIKPAVDLETQVRRTLIGDGTFEFRTRALNVDSCALQSADDSDATIELNFNQKVAPADLMAKLRVTLGDGKQHVEPVCLTREPSDRLIIRTPHHRDPAHRVNIEIDHQLAGAGGELPLGIDFSRQIDLPWGFVLINAKVDEPGLERDVTVRVQFSQSIDDKQAAPKPTIDPAVSPLHVHVEDRSLVMSGRFEPGKRYRITIPGQLVAKGGKSLGHDEEVKVNVPDHEPAVRIPLSHGILSPQGNLLLDVDVVNVNGVEVQASRVYANNLVSHVRGAGTRATSTSIASKKIKLDAAHNEPTKAALDLRALVGSKPGIFQLEVKATDHAWTQDSAIVTISDLALTSKRTRDGLFIWVTSLRTGKPVEGADVSALSYNNQTLGATKTGADGTATIALPRHDDERSPWIITAALGDDLNYLRPEQRPWVIDDVDQTGREVPENYDVLLYTERGVYRPGDTIHLTGLIRETDGQVPPPFPMSIRLSRPDGKKLPILTVKPTPDTQGFFQVDVPTREDGQTGRYAITATLPGSDEVLGSTATLVEAFAPVRIELNADATQPRFGPGKEATADVSARYLFGPPAAKLPLAVHVTYVATAYRSKSFPEFTFGDRVARPTYAPDAVEAELDAEGRAHVELAPPKDASAARWRADCVATVTEPGGRSLSHSFSTIVDTTPCHIGLRLADGQIAPVGRAVRAEVVALTGDDAPAEPAPLKLTLARIEHDNVLQQVNGTTVWKTTERAIPLWSKTLAASGFKEGRGDIEITCSIAGEYRLTAAGKSGRAKTTLDFYASTDTDESQSMALSRAERLEIVLDAKHHRPGGQATALIRGPFAGTLLLTLETDRIVQHRIVEMEQNSTSVTLDLPADLRGSAFLTGSLIRAVDPTHEKWLPHRAMGMARLITENTDHALPVKLILAPSAVPGETIDAIVETPVSDGGAPGVAHLWAVDDGILLTTAYSAPDPLAHFLAPRQASIASADVFADLLPDHLRPESMNRIGADGDSEGLGLRGNPVPMRQRDPAVVWRSVEPFASDGRLVAKLSIPKMTGSMRVMAIAVSGDRYGTAHAAITVASPLLCEASWPRFVAPDDRFKTPIKLFNTTKDALTAKVTLDVQGPLAIDSPTGTADAEVPANGSSTLWVAAHATNMGPIHVHVVATATSSNSGALTADCEANFPCRPAAPLHHESAFLTVKAGDSIDIAPPAGYLPGSIQRTVSISANPTVDLRPAVEQLIDYPYGCVEQTSSQLYAMLYAPDLLALNAPNTDRAKHIAGMVDAGIARLWSMQTRDGGIGYWPGASQADTWGTAYAASCLAAAVKAGYKVEPAFIHELEHYLDRMLSRSGREDMDNNDRAQICYVLATFDRPSQGWLDRLSQRLDRLDMSGRAHLAAGWIAAGRKDRAAQVLSDDVLGQSIATTTSGRFVSQTQSEALLLSVLLDLDPRHAWIAPLVQRLNSRRTDGRWGTTLENAAAISALAKYQLVVDEHGEFQGTLTCGAAESYTFSSAGQAQFTLADALQPARIESTGQGDIHVCLSIAGRLLDDVVKPFDRQLVVRRKWMDRDGKRIDPARLRVGELIRVRVTLSAPGLRSDATVGNIAIVDALPGGVEVENPRLATSAKPATANHKKKRRVHPESSDAGAETADVSDSDSDAEAGADAEASAPAGDNEDASAADRVEFLDDRVVLFTSANHVKRHFDYYLRVVSVGSFVIPPIEASCMYDPAFASLHGGGHMEVGE